MIFSLFANLYVVQKIKKSSLARVLPHYYTNNLGLLITLFRLFTLLEYLGNILELVSLLLDYDIIYRKNQTDKLNMYLKHAVVKLS